MYPYSKDQHCVSKILDQYFEQRSMFILVVNAKMVKYVNDTDSKFPVSMLMDRPNSTPVFQTQEFGSINQI